MKKEYQKPNYEIILLSEENVITASGGGGAWDTPEIVLNSQNPMSDTVWE